MKNRKPIVFPRTSAYYTFIFYNVQETRTIKAGLHTSTIPIHLFCAHELISGTDRLHVDPVRAMQAAGRHLVAAELFIEKCEELEIPYRMAEEIPAEKQELELSRHPDSMILRGVHFDQAFYDKVDKDLLEMKLYDRLAKGVGGVPELAPQDPGAGGKGPVQNPGTSCPQALGRRGPQGKEGRSRTRTY